MAAACCSLMAAKTACCHPASAAGVSARYTVTVALRLLMFHASTFTYCVPVSGGRLSESLLPVSLNQTKWLERENSTFLVLLPKSGLRYSTAPESCMLTAWWLGGMASCSGGERALCVSLSLWSLVALTCLVAAGGGGGLATPCCAQSCR